MADLSHQNKGLGLIACKRRECFLFLGDTRAATGVFKSPLIPGNSPFRKVRYGARMHWNSHALEYVFYF